MAKAKVAATAIAVASKMKPGKASRRMKTRFIILYGPPKSRKTTSASKLNPARTKWVISDSNCLGEETEFITSQGVRSFRDCNENERVVVLTHLGNWKPAIVKSYGAQPLQEVTFGRGQNTQTVRATAGHRWLLADGKVVRTSELRPTRTTRDYYYKLAKPPHLIRNWAFEESSEEQKTWWLQGFVWGDGSTAFSHGKELGSKLRLCETKTRFLQRIEDLGFSATYPPSSEGEPNFYLRNIFKRLPSADIGLENMMAFVRGFLDADGTRNTREGRDNTINPFQGISQTGEESVAFVRKFFPMVGAYVVNEWDHTDMPTGYAPAGTRETTSFFSLVMGFSNSPVAPYNVRDVGPLGVPEKVWCLDVEDDHSFVLPNGIVTMNCIATLTALDRLPPDDNIYEVTSVPEAREITEEAIGICESEGVDALGVDAFVYDSGTAFSDWHQQDIAKMSGQRFMGDNSKNNGWQQFNAEFGQFLDSLAILSKHVNVVLICHAKEKADLSKGEWVGLNLSPQMALKAGRLGNWVLYQTCRDIVVDEKAKEDAFIQNIVTERDGSRKGKEVIINTMPSYGWIASVNAKHLKPEEPGDLQALLEKEGLL